ncbi:hypothetical protein DPEC_G00184380 [Dallia pectoralis]|uniref:Uncharacterized protein n=1 Tax=Dallia pectoralis TaxID=75939 RepID=A0ACC2GB96_DALPE|nr:hypothetical protein DPEC_G00184380 [Dallia pectoralis]
MNDSSENQTSFDSWKICLDEGHVAPVLYYAAQALCFLLGTPALVWCLWISLKESISGGLKPTQVFPINLFAAELVFCVEGPMDMTSYVFMRQDTILKKVVFVFYYLSWSSRPLFQCCICVERYMAVAQPVAFLKYRFRRYRMGTSTVIWVLSLLYGYSTTLLKFNENVSIYVLIGVCCLGVVVTSLCCFFILRVLKQPGPGEVEGGRGGEKKQGTTDPQKMRAFSIVLTNLVIIVVSSISVLVGLATVSFSLDCYCNVSPIFCYDLQCRGLTLSTPPQREKAAM